MESPSRRIASLDVGRFAACLYVMLFHASIDVRLENVVLRQGFSGVEFFMMLSGYVLARPYVEARPMRPFELRRFAVGRITRILPPYYVVVLVAAALSFFRVGTSATPVPRAELGWHVFTHLVMIHTFFAATFHSLVSVLWSLGLEWQYYVVLPVLLLAFRAGRTGLVMLAVVVVTLATRWALRELAPGHGDLLSGVFLARLTEFAVGVALAVLLGQGWARGRLVTLAVAAGGVGLAATALGVTDREMTVQGIVLVAFVLLRLFGPAVATNRVTRLLQFLGEVSYSTYLVHTLAGKTSLAVLGHLPVGESLGPWPRVILYTLAGQLSGIAFYFVVERPTTRWAGALFARDRAAGVGHAAGA